MLLHEKKELSVNIYNPKLKQLLINITTMYCRACGTKVFTQRGLEEHEIENSIIHQMSVISAMGEQTPEMLKETAERIEYLRQKHIREDAKK